MFTASFSFYKSKVALQAMKAGRKGRGRIEEGRGGGVRNREENEDGKDEGERGRRKEGEREEGAEGLGVKNLST